MYLVSDLASPTRVRMDNRGMKYIFLFIGELVLFVPGPFY